MCGGGGGLGGLFSPRPKGIDTAFNPIGRGGSSGANAIIDPGGLITATTINEAGLGGPLGGTQEFPTVGNPPSGGDVPGLDSDSVKDARDRERERLRSAMGFSKTIKTSGTGVSKRAATAQTILRGE